MRDGRDEKNWRPFKRKGDTDEFSIELTKLEKRLMNAIEKLTAAVDRAIAKKIELQVALDEKENQLVEANAKIVELEGSMEQNADKLNGELGVSMGGKE